MRGQDGWDLLAFICGKAITLMRRHDALSRQAKIVIVIRDDESDSQYIAGEVRDDVSGFLRRAATTYDKPAAMQGTIAVDASGNSLPAETLGPCPKCGLPIAAATGENPGMLHALPMCSEFERRGPLDFAEWVRVQRGGNN